MWHGYWQLAYLLGLVGEAFDGFEGKKALVGKILVNMAFDSSKFANYFPATQLHNTVRGVCELLMVFCDLKSDGIDCLRMC